MKERLSPYARPLLVTLGWGTSFGGVTLWAVFQGLLLPGFASGPPPDVAPTAMLRVALYYSAVVGVSVLSGMVITDMGRTIGGIVGSYMLGGLIVFEVLSVPGLSESALRDLNLFLTREALTSVAVDLTFRILFPFPIFALLFGGILGAALEERYL